MKQSKQIFHKKYDNYYLFLDNEIVNNKSFYSRVKSFSIKNLSSDLKIEYLNIIKSDISKENYVFTISNSLPYSLEVLANEFYNSNKTFEDLLFEFLVYDSNNNWAIYCNIGYDFGLGACDNDICDLFLNEIAPYEKFSFDEKLKDIESSFTNVKKRKCFVSDLLSKFDFIY